MATMVHVTREGYHPHNTWQLRPDGLYELAGAVRAFTEPEVTVCTQTHPVWEDCACWDTPQGHVCPLPDCLMTQADRRTREAAHTCGPGIGYGCAAPGCDGDSD